MVMVFGWNIDFGDGASNRVASGPGFFTPPTTGVRLVTGLTSDLGAGLHLISVTPDRDRGSRDSALVSVPVPPTIPKVSGSPVRPIGATTTPPSSMDPFAPDEPVKASSPSGLSGPSGPSGPLGSSIAPLAKPPSSASIPMLVQVPARAPIGATATSASYADPFVSSGTVKATSPLSSLIAAASAPLAKSPSSGSTIPGVQPVQHMQPVQRAPVPAGPVSTDAAPSVLVVPVAPVGPVVPVSVSRFVLLGSGGAALEAALGVDTARLKSTTTFLSGTYRHALYLDADGATSLFRDSNTIPPSPLGGVELYPLTEVIRAYGDPGPEFKATLIFRRPGASDASDAILAKLGQAGYKHVMAALGTDFGARAMWSVVGIPMWWACPEPRTVVRSAPPGSALVLTEPRAYKEPTSLSCRVFSPADVPAVTTVTTVTTVATPTQLQPVAKPAAPPNPLSPAVLALIKASVQQPVQQPAQVQPASQPQPVSQPQLVQQHAQLVTGSSLGCSELELEGCLASASGGDILACGNALRAFGVCAGAAGAAGDAASWLRYSGTGSLIPLRNLTSGALYGSDAERAYTVVPDLASPSRGKLLVSSPSSPSGLSSVYTCALTDNVWAVVSALPESPAEPRLEDTTAVQVHYTRTGTTAPTTKPPDLTILWIVLGALGFALCLGALYAASRPRGARGGSTLTSPQKTLPPLQ